jgi:hypothetical protein
VLTLGNGSNDITGGGATANINVTGSGSVVLRHREPDHRRAQLRVGR